MATSSSTVNLPPAPPPVPRPLTPAARRRGWMEPRVRFWWLCGLVLMLVALNLLITHMVIWARELKIVRQGTPITATIESIGEGEFNGQGNISPDSYPVKLTFDFNGQSYEVGPGFLEGWTDPISPKEMVPIRIDPDDPYHWTSLTVAPPILHALLAFLLVLPFALALLAAGIFLRLRVLRLWQTGAASPFMVDSTSQSALAPSSRVVHCKDAEGRTTRLVTVFIPRRIADPKPGDILWLIHRSDSLEHGVAAMTYG